MNKLDFENLIGYNLGKSSHLMINSFHKVLQQLGLDITLHQVGMLHFINCNGESNQQELAEVMDKDKSAVLRSIDVLERKGYVKRTVDSTDRRKNLITLTGKAHEMLEAVKPHFLSHMEHMTEEIPEKDIQTCMSVLRKLQENARKIIDKIK